MTGRWWSLGLTLLAAAVLGWFAAQPPAPLPAGSPPDQFSATRALADIRVIAAEPHPTGSAANDHVRAYLTQRLQALGFTVREYRAPLDAKGKERLAKWRGAPADNAETVSLIATREPLGAEPAVAVMAHYDSVWGSPGAADDAAGTAAALEIARAVSGEPHRRGLVLLITDGEELGLEGARAVFAGDPIASSIGVIVNMETRGGGGRASMFETGADNGPMVGLYRSAVRDPYANSLAVKIYELLPNDTDYTVAKQRNIPGFNFAFIGRAGLYHSPLATPDAIELGAVQHMGAQALATTRALLAAPALPGPGPDAVFSDFLGLFVIAYPAVIGWGLVVLAAALVVAAFRGGGFRSSSVAAGLARGLGFTLLVAGLTWLANWLSLAAGKPNYYDRLAALPRLELAALAMALAALGVMAATAGTPTMRRGNWLGLALLNLLIAIVVQAMLPAAGPMLVWPVLLGLVAPALAAPRPAAPWLAGLFAVVALAMIGQGAHAFLLAIGITVPSAIAIFGPVTALLLWPLLPGRAGRSAVTLILLGIVAAAALALWVRLDPVAASAATYSLSQS